MNIKKIYWLIFSATIGIYAIMLFWSLPKIMAASGGLLPFDLRPKGYSFADAQQMLNALSVEGTEFYMNIQAGMLDMIFPALLFLTLALAYWLLMPEKWGKWRFLATLVALPGSVFDYLENFSIIKMLELGADNITVQNVICASTNSSYKSIFVTISLVLLLALIALWFVRKYQSKNKQ
ncbi:MAG: hypothetical protein L3J15_06080 [Devosiaceae bacterium]|nr:hypothetical protein [Devosiaceae bacterium]